MLKYLILLMISKIIFTGFIANTQELDTDELLEKIERLEKNVSDLQKGKFDKIDKSLSTGYISRNEKRLDENETNTRANFGLIEEVENKIKQLEERFNLLNQEYQSKIGQIEKQLKNAKSKTEPKQKKSSETIPDRNLKFSQPDNNSEFESSINETEIKKKYENAIKLLWANKYNEAETQLLKLKKLNPEDLMPNIQYWLGEVYYANKNFEQAVIEFGEGFQRFPNSIKGPDNLLKLGLSFSNLNKKNDACNAFYELELKFKNAAKNVIERSQSEREKLDCPIE